MEKEQMPHPKKCVFASVVMFAVLAMWNVGLHGCVTITPASTERGSALIVPQPMPEEAWPRRYPEPVKALIASPNHAEPDYRDHVARLVGLFNTNMRHTPFGRGIVSELPQTDSRYTRQMVYITNRFNVENLQEVFGGDHPTSAEREKLLRWHFRLHMPERQEPRGLIIHLTSLGDRRFERSVSQTLHDRGWAVLHVVPGRMVIPFLHENIAGQGRRIVDAAEIAGVLDEFAADYAYAVEGVLDYLKHDMPMLAEKPLVITGYSAGSLAAPTVAAKLNGRVDAAVLVGSGANVAGILVDGKITNVVQVLHNTGEPHLLRDLRAMPAKYLPHSRFDPYHMAKYLRGKPVLMLQGQFDQIVPPQYGDLLYEQLGRPERWTYPIGHIMLFWALPSQAGSIANWIENAVER